MRCLKFYFFLLFLTFFLSCNEKGKEYKPINKLESLKNNDSLMNSIIDLRIHMIKIYDDYDKSEEFQKFIKIATIDNLIYLTDCEIPLVRCFAFKGLVIKDYPKVKEIALNHVNDIEVIKRQYHDIEIPFRVFDFMLNELHPMSNSKYKFNKKEYDFYSDLEKQ
jgi:hypothetical protein